MEAQRGCAIPKAHLSVDQAVTLNNSSLIGTAGIASTHSLSTLDLALHPSQNRDHCFLQRKSRVHVDSKTAVRRRQIPPPLEDQLTYSQHLSSTRTQSQTQGNERCQVACGLQYYSDALVETRHKVFGELQSLFSAGGFAGDSVDFIHYGLPASISRRL